MSDEINLFVGTDGSLEFVYDDDVALALEGLGPRTTFRASYVEPDKNGLWEVDVAPIVGSDVPRIIGAWPTRAGALAAEKDWVETYLAYYR